MEVSRLLSKALHYYRLFLVHMESEIGLLLLHLQVYRDGPIWVEESMKVP